jgi:hypothetical protein
MKVIRLYPISSCGIIIQRIIIIDYEEYHFKEFGKEAVREQERDTVKSFKSNIF